MVSVSSFKPSGRSGKMRALSFKTGIACLCGTEVKEKLQCECNSSICSDVGGGRGVAEEAGGRPENSLNFWFWTLQRSTHATW